VNLRPVERARQGRRALDSPAKPDGEAQAAGHRGRIGHESGTATPWIPRGKSGWEFGCDKNAARKAESDHQTRTANVSTQTRKNTTFVFITPRNWSGKGKWATDKKALEEWKDVRGFDASDLEQWLEQSVPAQKRFREWLFVPFVPSW
jgi:hypothetical protein